MTSSAMHQSSLIMKRVTTIADWLSGEERSAIFRAALINSAGHAPAETRLDCAQKWHEGDLSESDHVESGLHLIGCHFNVGTNPSCIDDLTKKILESALKLENKVLLCSAYRNRGRFQMNSARYDEAEKSFDTALELAKQIDDLREMSGALGCVGRLKKRRGGPGDLYTALRIFREELEVSKKSQDTHSLARSYGEIASVERMLGNYDEARNCLERCMKINEDDDDRSGVAVSRLGLGKIDIVEGKFESAYNHISKSKQIAREICSVNLLADCHVTLASYFEKIGDLERCIETQLQLLKLNRDSGNKGGESKTLLILGRVCMKNSQFDEALEYLASGLRLNEGLKSLEGVARFRLTSAKVLIKMERYDEATSHLQKALEINKELGHPPHIFGTLAQLALVFTHMGEHLEAAKMNLKAFSITSFNHESEMAFISLRHVLRSIHKSRRSGEHEEADILLKETIENGGLVDKCLNYHIPKFGRLIDTMQKKANVRELNESNQLPDYLGPFTTVAEVTELVGRGNILIDIKTLIASIYLDLDDISSARAEIESLSALKLAEFEVDGSVTLPYIQVLPRVEMDTGRETVVKQMRGWPDDHDLGPISLMNISKASLERIARISRSRGFIFFKEGLEDDCEKANQCGAEACIELCRILISERDWRSAKNFIREGRMMGTHATTPECLLREIVHLIEENPGIGIERHNGEIKFIVEDKEYGFITRNESENDLHFWTSNNNIISSGLVKGDLVSFEIGMNSNGETAESILKIEEDDEFPGGSGTGSDDDSSGIVVQGDGNIVIQGSPGSSVNVTHNVEDTPLDSSELERDSLFGSTLDGIESEDLVEGRRLYEKYRESENRPDFIKSRNAFEKTIHMKTKASDSDQIKSAHNLIGLLRLARKREHARYENDRISISVMETINRLIPLGVTTEIDGLVTHEISLLRWMRAKFLDEVDYDEHDCTQEQIFNDLLLALQELVESGFKNDSLEHDAVSDAVGIAEQARHMIPVLPNPDEHREKMAVVEEAAAKMISALHTNIPGVVSPELFESESPFLDLVHEMAESE